MQDKPFIHGLEGLKPHHRGCVATIGSFDGVHRGHQNLLARLKLQAQLLRLPSTVIVFEPQPSEFFAGPHAPVRLMRLREKVNALLACGIDRVLCLKFNAQLRNYSAQRFIEEILVQRLGVQHLQVGDDFRFGSDRAGDFALLEAAGEQLGFGVSSAPTFTHEDQRVSSTRVRQLLAAGQLTQASALLGAPYLISGRVMYGKQVGRAIGVPTANIALGRKKPALSGVYAVRVRLQNLDGSLSGDSLPGVANIGMRPTVGDLVKPLLEVHLFSFTGDLYGRCLSVEFWHKLRGEQKFESLAALQGQIQADIDAAQKYFIG